MKRPVSFNLLALVVGLLLAGCGSGSSSSSSGGPPVDPGVAPTSSPASPETIRLLLDFTPSAGKSASRQGRGLPLPATRLIVHVLDLDGFEIPGSPLVRSHTPHDPDPIVVALAALPGDYVAYLEALDGNGVLLGLSTVPIRLEAGQVVQAVLDDTLGATSLAVAPADSLLPLQGERQFSSTVSLSDQSTVNITSVVAWSLSTESVATISARGMARGVSTGITTIRAAHAGLEASASLRVGTVQLMTLAPPAPSVAVGDTLQIQATATFSDGSTLDVTREAAWSSDSAAASVDADGRVQGIWAGQAQVTAAYGGVLGVATIHVVVVPTVQSIAVGPTDASVAVGDTLQLEARATFSDGSTQDVTSRATWSSDSAASVDAAGLATGATIGQARVTATYAGVTGAATLQVVPVPLRGVAADGPLMGTLAAVGGTRSPLILTSQDDGATWIERTAPSRYRLNAVAWSSATGRFVAVGNGGDVVESPDGITWTDVSPSSSVDWNGVAEDGNGAVVVGNGGSLLMFDGTTWTARSSGTSQDLLAVACDGEYVAVGRGGTILTSADGITWEGRVSGTTADILAVSPGGSPGIRYLAVDAAGQAIRSDDGITWTAVPVVAGALRGVAGGFDMEAFDWVMGVVGDDGVLFTSSDGITWTARNSGTTQTLRGVVGRWPLPGVVFAAVGDQRTTVSVP